MFAITILIDHLKKVFPGEFKNGRYRGTDEPFDLNGFNISDFIFIPDTRKQPSAGEIARTFEDDQTVIFTKSIIGIFIFTKKVDLQKTFNSVLNGILNSPVDVVITKRELDANQLLKDVFGKSTADPSITVFGIWMTVSEMVTMSNINCEICYDIC